MADDRISRFTDLIELAIRRYQLAYGEDGIPPELLHDLLWRLAENAFRAGEMYAHEQLMELAYIPTLEDVLTRIEEEDKAKSGGDGNQPEIGLRL
jgi:hypothetical protein